MKNKILMILFLIGYQSSFSQPPGGISSNLQLWLKANTGVLNLGGSSAADGQSANTWQDQTTARSNDAINGSLQPPTYRDNTNDCINYNPVVDFDGVDDGLHFGNDYIYSTGVGSQDGMTWFAVVEPDSSTARPLQYVVDFGLAATDGYGFMYGSSHYGIYTGVSHSGAASLGQTHTFGIAPSLARFTVDFGTNQTLNINGAPPSITNAISLGALTALQIAENPVNASNSGPVTIGRQCKNAIITGNGGRRLDGSIAEIIGYNADLSETSGADISRIESYLAIKYGLTLDNSNGGAAGDYFSSLGSTFWDASLSPSYHNDVIGIGRDDNSALIQKQSHQLDDSTRIYLSTLSTSNTANVGAFSTNGQFVMMGHNTDELKSLGSTEFPSGLGIFSRLEREWKITNTAFNGTFSLDITLNTLPLTASDLRILIDDDGNFANATMYNPSITVSGNTVSISGLSTTEVPTNTTRYLTLVSLNSTTPLPIELLNFDLTLVNNNLVELSWQTASETNNDYFTIERSPDGFNWEEVIRIDGAGNSSNLLSYSTIDNNPYYGTSYYRLKQTDFDGQFEYSQIKSIHIMQLANSTIVIFPNPAENLVTVRGDKYELEQLKIYNTLGQDVTSFTNQSTLDNSKLIIDLSNLSKGMYYVRTKTTSNKVYKQ